MRKYLDTITMRHFKHQSGLEISAQDILIARGDQLHVLMLTMVFVYAIFFSVANFYFNNFPQAYLTMVPIPLEILFYIFFRMGGRWMIVSKMANLLLIICMLSLLKMLDGPSTGVLAFFIPVIVGSMITLQGKQRPYAWFGISIALCVLGFLSITEIHLHPLQAMSEAKLLQERLQNYVGSALATIFQVGFLIWVSNQLQHRLVENEQEQQRLITRINLQTQERQRNEVAVELHENINQILASAKINLSRIDPSVKDQEAIRESEEHIEYALLQIRKLYHTLATPDLEEFDLPDLTRQMVDDLFAEEDVRIMFDARLDSSHILSDEIKLSLYRIAQEYLQEVRANAQASSLEIRLQDQPGRIEFSIRDDGQKILGDLRSPDMVLRSIQSRVTLHQGTFAFESIPDKGNLLSVAFSFS